MNRINKFLIAFIALLFCNMTALADVAMYIPSATLDAGAKQNISINLRNTQEVTAFQFDVKLPDGVSVNNTVNEDEETVPDIRLTSRKKSKHQLTCQLQNDGSYRVVVISMGNQIFSGDDGAIVNIGVTAQASMQTGSYPVILKEIHIVPFVDGKQGERIDQQDYTGYINVSNSGQSSDIDVKMRVSTAELNAGSKSERIAIGLDNNINVTAFQFDIKLPSGISVNDYMNEDDEKVPDIQLTSRKRSSHTLSCNKREDGTYTVVVMSMKNQALSGDAGDVVIIGVSVPNTMIGNYPISISNIHVVPLVNGSPGIRMDLPNVSQTISVKNTGSEIPVSDNYFSIAPLTLEPGGVGTIDIELNNEDEICSFQFNLKLPSGISVVKEYNEDDEFVEAISLSERKKSTHDLNFKQTEDGGYFLISYSLNNASFKGNSGSLVRIKVKADESMSYGDYGVAMSNILLVTPDEEKIEVQGFSGTLTIAEEGAVDGIYSESAAKVYSSEGNCIVENLSAGDKVEVYGLDGIKLTEETSMGTTVTIPVNGHRIVVVSVISENHRKTYKLTIK